MPSPCPDVENDCGHHGCPQPVVTHPWRTNAETPDPGVPLYFQMRGRLTEQIYYAERRELLHAGIWWDVLRWAYAHELAPEVEYES